MKTTIPFKFCIVLLLCLVFNVSAQNNRSATKNFVWALSLPYEKDRGPMRIGISGTYHFEREKMGEQYYASLHITFSKMSFMDQGDPAYKYRGKAYLASQMNAADGLGNSGFDQLQISQLSFKIQVLAAQANLGGSNPFITVQSDFEVISHAAEISKETNLDHLDLMWAGSFITNINWNNSTALEGRIYNLEKLQKNKEEYKSVIQQADNAFGRNNLEEAKSLYERAERLSPNENYPKTQLAKIERALSEKQKKENDARNSPAAENTRNTNTQQPIIKQPAQKTAEEIKQEQKNDANAQVAAHLAKLKQQQENARQMEAEMTAKFNNLSRAYDQGRQAGESFDAIKEASLSKKIFNSIDELNQEFDNQLQVIQQESKNYATVKAAAVSSYVDATSNAGTQYDAAINSGLKMLGGLVSQMQANKAERENRERLIAEREAQLRAMEARRKEALFGMRRKLFELFPDGKLPLESNNVKQDQVYVFAYNSNKDALLTQENGAIAVSNVIAINKLDDGSFPYKSAFKNNLKKFGAGDVFIMGYYLNESDAERMHDSFIELATKSSLQIKNYNYKTTVVKNSSSATTNSKDFWETGETKTQENVGKTETQKTGNFWND